MSEDKFEISLFVCNQLFKYLQTKPYGEVVELIEALKQVKRLEPPKPVAEPSAEKK